MKEYTKNKNEYRADGRLYVEKIKSCAVDSFWNGKYCVVCKIHQRGRNYYYCGREAEYLQKDPHGNGRRLWLSADARAAVAAEIEKYESDIAAAKAESSCVSAELSDEIGLKVWYKHGAGNKYDLVAGVFLNGAVRSYKVSRRLRLEEMLHQLRFIRSESGLRSEGDSDKEYELIFAALYKSAEERGDELMQLEMKLWNNTADREDTERLSALLGRRILPPLRGDAAKKKYAVIAGTVDHALLHDSGYTFLHRPYFAMKGSTHDRITIVPFSRTAVDAAKEDMEEITFEEFLKLFDGESTEEK